MKVVRQDLTTASFWRLVWLHRADICLSWDLWLAAFGAAVSATLNPKQESIVIFASAAVAVTSAIIGIVLAGLAIVTAFLDAKYVRAISQAGHGIASEVFSFRYPAVVAVLSVVFSSGLILASDEGWYTMGLQWLLPTTVFLFLYTLFITLNLVAAIGGHMMNRSTQLAMPEVNEPLTHHHMQGRKGDDERVIADE